MPVALASQPQSTQATNAAVAVRRFPYPYRAMLAICSDLDETPEAATYFELMRFLNTTEATSMGPGVGLEVGNSIYFDMAPGHFSYWNAADHERVRIRALIQSGHIDVLHSYGDLATTRSHAGRALDELSKHDCQLRVWVDHAVAPTNLGADIMHGHGDEPAHAAYHADLTLAHGIQYVWRGRVTSVIGQDRPFRFKQLISDYCPLISVPHSPPARRAFIEPGVTLVKESAKRILARCGHRKYAMHTLNRLLRPIRLRNGAETREFLRCNPHWGGVSCGDRGDTIHEVLTPRFLDRLVQRGGACILYTHLGKLDRGADRHRFSPAVVAAFCRLADYHRSGKVLVTTTRRMLDYHRLLPQVQISTAIQGRRRMLRIANEPGPSSGSFRFENQDLAGLTIYVTNSENLHFDLDGSALISYSWNPADETGRPSISIAFPRLEFPQI